MTTYRCRDKAREILEIAARTADPSAKAALESLAADWIALADKAQEDLLRSLLD